MFGVIGWVLLVLALALATLARHGPMLLLGVTLVLAAVASHVWGRRSLDGVEYRRRLSTRCAAFGEAIDLTVEVVNRKLLPLAWLEANDDIPLALAPRGARVYRTHLPTRTRLANLMALRPYERVRRHFRLECRHRGEHVFGPATLRSGDLFGVAVTERTEQPLDTLIVFPRVLALPDLGFPKQQPLGDLRAQSWLFEDPTRLSGVRDYRPTDPLRRIHWRATARAQSLQVKTFDATTTQQIAVLLNLVTVEGPGASFRYDPDRAEGVISVAASIAVWALDAGFPVGLWVNSRPRLAWSSTSVPVGRGSRQKQEILEALARLPTIALEPFDRVLRSAVRRFGHGTIAVVVSAVCDDPLLAVLRELVGRGRRVVLVLVGGDLPRLPLPGVLVRHVEVAALDALTSGSEPSTGPATTVLEGVS